MPLPNMGIKTLPPLMENKSPINSIFFYSFSIFENSKPYYNETTESFNWHIHSVCII